MSKKSSPSATNQQLSWKIGAPAGFGVMTTGLLMAKLATRAGAQIACYPEYPSLIQGGHNTFEVTAQYSQHPFATKKTIDCLVCLNTETYDLHIKRLSNHSLVIFDPSINLTVTKGTALPVPLSELQAELKADKIMINAIALGASAAAMGVAQEIVQTLISDQFSGKKSLEIAEVNQRCAHAGYEYVLKHHSAAILPFFSKSSPVNQTQSTDLTIKAITSIAKEDSMHAPEQMVMTGNEAFSLAAVAADCRFYAAYPMTPTSTVLAILAGWQQETGMVVRHAEDEISVINTAFGASFAGARSAVGTSGGGFALMVETVSLAGITETPIVILMGQRSGPATGMPTWTEQGDLLFSVNAGHGEFPKIVLAPGDLEEMLEMTIAAFDYADIYQTPVILLTDKYLAESHASLDSAIVQKILKTSPRRGKWLISWDQSKGEYLRFKEVADGISPRLRPGTPGAHYQANSYEHLENTHTTEDAAERIKQVNKRSRKITTYSQNEKIAPQLFGPAEASTTLVGWGSTKNPVLAALSELNQSPPLVNYLHFTHLYPLDIDNISRLFANSNAKYLLVENNSTAQFGQLLRQLTGINLDKQLLKYDGRPLFKEEIIKFVTEAQS